MRPASLALAVASLSLLIGWQTARAAAPLEHTTHLANDDPWTSGQYQLGGGNNSHQANQYGATIGNGSAAASTSPLDRAQGAVVGTAGTLRDGVEAGVQQANQQFSQVFGQTQSSPSTQFAPPPSYSSTVSAATGSLPSTSTATAPSTSSGWTSIRADMAPPRLLPPSLVPLATSNNAVVASNSSAAPSFPSSLPTLNSGGSSATTSSNGTDHSVLTGPGSDARSSPSAATAQGTSRPADGNNSSSSPNSSLPRVGPEVPRAASRNSSAETDVWNRPAPAATQSNSGFATSGDRYSQPAPTTQNAPNLFPDFSAPSTTSSATPSGFNNPAGFGNQPATSAGNSPNRFGVNQPGFGPQNTMQPTPGQPAGNMATYGYGNQGMAMNGQQLGPDQLPWLPLLVVSLCLAGSFGANVYLGWSYADARYRYQSLVRKSTDSFHRATAAAHHRATATAHRATASTAPEQTDVAHARQTSAKRFQKMDSNSVVVDDTDAIQRRVARSKQDDS
jgi:hypothetical protein